METTHDSLQFTAARRRHAAPGRRRRRLRAGLPDQAQSRWSCPTRSGAPPTSWRAWSRRRSATASGNRWWSTTARAAAATSAGARCARSAPDGYTLLTTEMSFTIAPALGTKQPFDPKKDFSHIITAAAAPHVLVVNPRCPRRRCRSSSPRPRRIRASSTTAPAATAPTRIWGASCSSARPASTSCTSRTRAPARCCRT